MRDETERMLKQMLESGLESRFHQYLRAKGYVRSKPGYSYFAHYLSYFDRGDEVLDAACGEGYFLEALAGKGCRPLGVDLDPGMVDAARRLGCEVVQADLFDFLKSAHKRFDGIFASHLAEHLEIDALVEFIRLSFQALKPGGTLLLVTPNAASLASHLHEFWRSATHVRFYNKELLAFLLEDAGFSRVEARENPATKEEASPSGGMLAAVKRLFFPELRRIEGLFNQIFAATEVFAVGRKGSRANGAS